jgi:hypothetical protein
MAATPVMTDTASACIIHQMDVLNQNNPFAGYGRPV